MVLYFLVLDRYKIQKEVVTKQIVTQIRRVLKCITRYVKYEISRVVINV